MRVRVHVCVCACERVFVRARVCLCASESLSMCVSVSVSVCDCVWCACVCGYGVGVPDGIPIGTQTRDLSHSELRALIGTVSLTNIHVMINTQERVIDISLLIVAHFVPVIVHVLSFPFGSPS